MKKYRVTMPAYWFEIEAESPEAAKEEFWLVDDECEKGDDQLIVKEINDEPINPDDIPF